MLDNIEHMSQSELSELTGFVDAVRKSLSDKLTVMDHFNTLNATKAQWALSRY